MRTLKSAAAIGLLSCLLLPLASQADGGTDETNLLSWGAGALIVQAPPSYSDTGQWSADGLLDEIPGTGWATLEGDLKPKVFVFELADRSAITSLAFDTANVENPGRGAKNLLVEISDRKDGGFTEIAKPSLAQTQDGQKFPLKTPANGRYLKLTVLDNWGDEKYLELMDVYAYGKPLEKRALGDNTGAFSSSYSNFRLLQAGATVNGCYEHNNGLIENGGFDGRVLRFTWTEGDIPGPRHGGPAILIFADDGQSFTGFWWNEGSTNSVGGTWNGKRTSKVVGACPHWKPGTGSTVEQQLKSEGRVRLYGILFDTDSDHLKDESKTALDSLLAAARNEPTWNFTIEGHTDNSGAATHNQALSEKRAAAVKTYLVTAGVDPKRLTTQGFGFSQPVGSNDTSLGRSQNRRVEIVKK